MFHPTVLGFASTATIDNSRHCVGFDLGTSGARISIIKEANYEEIFAESISWDNGDKKEKNEIGSFDDPDAWMKAIDILLKKASETLSLSSSVVSICVSGTSASCLMIDMGLPHPGKVTRRPRMYNYDVTSSSLLSEGNKYYGMKAMQRIESFSPDKHTTRSPTGSLAKLFAWNDERPLQPTETLCHQADYVAMRLMWNDKTCGVGVQESIQRKKTLFSDWHNCLKLGYDVQNLQWPRWLLEACVSAGINNPQGVIPSNVVSPGQRVGTVSQDVAKRYGLHPETVIVGGTTDSNAAFFAALGSSSSRNSSSSSSSSTSSSSYSSSPFAPVIGTAVTSLGSTLAIKQWSRTYVEDADRGVYSHRFPSTIATNNDNHNGNGESDATWLVGGASNVGCAVLRQEKFSNEELEHLSKDIDPMVDSPLDYYPLAVQKGERFPIADSNKEPILRPVPETRSEYLHGILQGIASVESYGYRILGELGASPNQPVVVLTCGGGSKNKMWNRMRERILNKNKREEEQKQEQGNDDTHPTIRVEKAENTEASYGAAILAAASFSSPASDAMTD